MFKNSVGTKLKRKIKDKKFIAKKNVYFLKVLPTEFSKLSKDIS